jgi:signal transduction histidine kinase
MVKSYAEMIRDISGDTPGKRNAHLSVIIEEADRLNSLVGDMLSLSRIQSGSLPLEKSCFNLKDVILNILQSYELLCEREGYTLTLSCDDNIIISADKAKIEQVISNLVNNAVKYCGQDKSVIITVNKIAGKTRFEVEDHGMGIPQSEISHIWERYYKASTNHIRNTSGTGLGLAIVKELLTLHDAGFGVTSEYGKGSVFWFEL